MSYCLLGEIELRGGRTKRDTDTQEKCHCCENKCILYHQYKHLYKNKVLNLQDLNHAQSTRKRKVNSWQRKLQDRPFGNSIYCSLLMTMPFSQGVEYFTEKS